MKVRLKVTHAINVIGRWKESVQEGLGLPAVQEAAHANREEVFFFEAKDTNEAEQTKARIEKWCDNDPLASLEAKGWLTYETKVVG